MPRSHRHRGTTLLIFCVSANVQLYHFCAFLSRHKVFSALFSMFGNVNGGQCCSEIHMSYDIFIQMVFGICKLNLDLMSTVWQSATVGILIHQCLLAIVKYTLDFTFQPILHYEQIRLSALLPRPVFTVHNDYRKRNQH